jgi:hypothetical protein
MGVAREHEVVSAEDAVGAPTRTGERDAHG